MPPLFPQQERQTELEQVQLPLVQARLEPHEMDGLKPPGPGGAKWLVPIQLELLPLFCWAVF